jgi:hypothetical protein
MSAFEYGVLFLLGLQSGLLISIWWTVTNPAMKP